MTATPILSTRCTLPGQLLWFGRAELYADCIRLVGWTWSGRYQRTIDLDRVDRVRWWAVREDVNFLVHLENGRGLPLQLHQHAGLWNHELRDRLGLSKLAQSQPASVGSRRKKAA